MCLGASPDSRRPSMTAATTAGRVPLFGPGAERTLIPTISCVVTRLSQASRTLGLAVKLVIARLTMVRITSGRGRNASVASGFWTMTTRAREGVAEDEKGAGVAAGEAAL